MKSMTIEGSKYPTIIPDGALKKGNWKKPDPYKIYNLIPGTIIDILVKVGDTVEAGDTLMILDAMKMHNRILTEVSGEVKKIHVGAGDPLKKHCLLIELC